MVLCSKYVFKLVLISVLVCVEIRRLLETRSRRQGTIQNQDMIISTRSGDRKMMGHLEIRTTLHSRLKASDDDTPLLKVFPPFQKKRSLLTSREINSF